MSDSLDIDQRLARQLLLEGATLVFLDVPQGTEFGVDMKSWNTGDKFKGVKMIPPGLHYIYYK
jgi:A1 cistron-splicing factor AAR2